MFKLVLKPRNLAEVLRSIPSINLDKKSRAKLNTSSFMATELTIFKTAKTQSSSQSKVPKFVRAIKYRIVHFTIHRNTPSEGDFQI